VLKPTIDRVEEQEVFISSVDSLFSITNVFFPLPKQIQVGEIQLIQEREGYLLVFQ